MSTAKSFIPPMLCAAIVLMGTQATAQMAGKVGTGLAASRADSCYRDPGEACILAEALAQARRIEDAGSRAYRLLEIGEVLAKGRHKDEASRVFSEVHRLARAGTNKDDRHSSLARLAEAQAMAGYTDAAHSTARELPGGKRAEALLRIAEVSAENGDARETLRSLAAHRGLAGTERTDDLVRIAKVQVGIKDTRAARDTLARAEELWSRDQFKSWGTLARIAALQSRAGAETDARRNLDAAVRGVETGEKTGYGWEFSDLAVAQAEMGDSQAAFATIARMDAKGRVDALLFLATVLARAGDLRAVDTALVEMLKVGDAPGDSHQQDQTRRWVAHLRAETGRPEAALQDARAVKNAAMRAFSLADVARALAKLGRKAEGRAAIIEGLDAIRAVAGTFPTPATDAEVRALGLVALGQAAQELGF